MAILALVVYDSLYGNTKQVAEAMAAAIGDSLGADVLVLHHNQARWSEIQALGLLVIGSPTHAALPAESMRDFLGEAAPPAFDGAQAATFDTRLAWPFLERWGGFSAPKMAQSLEARGWTIAVPPEGFYVQGLRKGPLKKGEADRAARWGRKLVGLGAE